MDRPGAEADKINLKNLFKDLSFRVIVKKDLTKHEIETVAQRYGTVDHSEFDAFVFILMSHGGDRDCILGVDGRETTVKEFDVRVPRKQVSITKEQTQGVHYSNLQGAPR
ncbi:Caspase-7 [Desmophyllum pertusum]|uniref:Caspase-7 n=1 Tax=Desmophyllum pertusum TaxID=174260 RepID=A0A9W9ZMJ2_9CNID|nr:Caspase-7 [Desmophyllum pertusum]